MKLIPIIGLLILSGCCRSLPPLPSTSTLEDRMKACSVACGDNGMKQWNEGDRMCICNPKNQTVSLGVDS